MSHSDLGKGVSHKLLMERKRRQQSAKASFVMNMSQEQIQAADEMLKRLVDSKNDESIRPSKVRSYDYDSNSFG